MASKYAHFGSPPMSPSDFDAKPMVLVLGQVILSSHSIINVFFMLIDISLSVGISILLGRHRLRDPCYGNVTVPKHGIISS